MIADFDYSKIKAIIFDVDGTLYYQNKMRCQMAFRLMNYYLLRFWRIKDIIIIKEFRKARENNVFTEVDNINEQQYLYVANKLGIPVIKVQRIINRWMFAEPLKFLCDCRDNYLYTFIKDLQMKNILTVAYSDYPAEDKLSALKIDMDYCFSSTDLNINSLKPNPKGLRTIVEQLGINPDEILIIGDRDEKDGEVARLVNIPYVILPSALRYRNETIQLLHTKFKDRYNGGS